MLTRFVAQDGCGSDCLDDIELDNERDQVWTIARTMTGVGKDDLTRFGPAIRRLTLERLQTFALALNTLDFDGGVQGTTEYAERTAVGFNTRKRSSRSDYPLYCTVAQTS
jgi:hypothetical protein